MCDNYLLSYYRENIIEILKDPDETRHFSVDIDFVELSGNEPNLGNIFLRDPEKSLEEWNKAVHKVQTNLIVASEQDYIFKKHTHCRVHSLPLYPELHRIKLPRNDDTNKFLQVSGTVARTTAVKMMEFQRQYICTKCKYVVTAYAEYDFKNIITTPTSCENPDGCRGTSMVSMGELNAEFCKDYQEIKMEETSGSLDVGAMPSSIWVTLEDDLVDTCQPGDNIVVCGFVKRRQNSFVVGKKMEVELVIKANHLQVNNNNASALAITPGLRDMFKAFWKTYSYAPLSARDIILKSFCPELHGLYVVKLAMAIVLAGGSNLQKDSNTGVRVRTEPHLLLVGDTGTGKSEMLRFASKIIPRSILTTGVGSTAAGLTAAAIMENGEWQLEGGALVLSDGGICCIDEFNTIKEHDRTSIHEAMEQQTISVAKAGIVCKLNTRCSVLAATNPKGKLDPSQPLNMNVALASPLLSRFDLILLLKDTFDEDWDNQVVDFIFNSLKSCNSSKLSESINWTVQTLQAYFAVIKKIDPKLTEDSNRILSSYYQTQRKKCRNKSRTTVRLLDSLVRLSQGHARLMFHEEVAIVDAVTAVILVETSMETGSSVFNLSFDFRKDFPQDPTNNYKELVQIVLKRLDLKDLLEQELGRLNSNKPGPSRGNDSPIFQTESKFLHVANDRKSCRVKNDRRDKAPEGEGPSGVTTSEKNIPKEVENVNDRPGPSRGNNNSPISQTGPKSPSLTVKDAKQDTKPYKVDNANKLIAGKSRSKMIPRGEGPSGVRANSKKKLRDFDENNTIDVKDEGPDFSFSEKQNKFNKPRTKNAKLKNVSPKNQQKEISDDLAALGCMPSVHDVFRMDDCEADGINFSFDQVSNQGAQNPEKNSSKMEAVEEETPKDQDSVGSLKIFPRQTKPGNRFNKFKFIPKDTEQTESKGDQSSKDPKNPFESSEVSFMKVKSNTQREMPSSQMANKPDPASDTGYFNDDADVSFANVVTSTQQSLKNPDVEGAPTAKPTTKRFEFKKKAFGGDAKPPDVASKSPAFSIFECQDDADLDLDL